jgi:branched-chain amino acid transport system substrate-binding protein
MLRSGNLCVASALVLLASTIAASTADMPGVNATEIRIGQTMPYSGPVSAFGALGKGEVGYFRMLNEKGGINGRKVNLISLDDGYAPPKTVEQTRRLVESEEVALIFSSIGTAHNTAIAKYLQGRNIPQLFLASGASKFADVAQYPQATMGVRRRSATRPASMRAMRLRKIRMRNSRSFRRTTITGATICWA